MPNNFLIERTWQRGSISFTFVNSQIRERIYTNAVKLNDNGLKSWITCNDLKTDKLVELLDLLRRKREIEFSLGKLID